MRNFLRITTLAMALCLPLEAAAATLSVDDTVAGLGATASIRDAAVGDSLTLTFTGPRGDERISVVTDGNGRATAQLPGSAATLAGTYHATLTAGNATLANATFAVLPDSVDSALSTVDADRLLILPDGSDAARITVSLRDRYGNPLQRRPVTLVSSRNDDRVDMIDAETDDRGEQHFLLSTIAPGHISLRAIDLLSGQVLEETAELDAGRSPSGAASADSWNSAWTAERSRWENGVGANPYTAQVSGFDVIDHFVITAPATMRRGEEAAKITVRAVDRNGSTVEDYVGTVAFHASDPEAVLPNFGEYTFQPRDLGQKEFPLVLKFPTAGKQILSVEDANDPTIAGEVAIDVSGEGQSGGGSITITSHHDGQSVRATTITIAGKGPPYVNLIASGGTSDVEGETDRTGSFAIPITLDPSNTDVTIRVHDDSGRYDSGELHLFFDQNAPSIERIEFEPGEASEGQSVLVRVVSERGLASVTLTFAAHGNAPEKEVLLTEVASSPGVYQAFFPAPAAGSYQPIVAVTDQAGNSDELKTTFRVGLRGLSTVMGLRATPRANAVGLTWNAVPEPVDGYRIYVGDGNGTDFSYTLDTGSPATTATVAGLQSGTTYIFAVKALLGESESTDLSDIVSANILGLNLEVQPQDGGLGILWDFPEDAPVGTFLVEYGVENGVYTERRQLNGALRAATIRDLLNGVTYFLRVTPVTVTGERMEELAATGSGTPDGEGGFRAGTSDPVPFDPATAHLPNVPSNSQQGASSWMTWALFGIIAVAVLHRTRRKSMIHPGGVHSRMV